MPLPDLCLALLALLLTPGPTNTLLALAGAERGAGRATRLIPAELAAYLLTTIPLALAGTQVLAAIPALRPIITLMAAVWIAWLARRLWRLPTPHDGPAHPGVTPASVTPAKVFTTTLLNPKALLIGLVLLPSDTPLAPRAALFAGLIIVVAATWAVLGASLTRRRRSSTPALPPLLHRAAACWLALISVGMIAGSLTA